ncbi:S41 family peptidase [Pseudorhodoferax sp.]|jgi:carboxyl-terminal processing protease|uniref:S41 family peptidase n=1 Tax=Pseudorhodoferax sp. TaxID=1993553 RepID=UPI001B44147F|nr:S41 family peptidase [Pseudorhodoferax sp.]MBP8145414.1 S41 family peptidase [Inhella sp.]
MGAKMKVAGWICLGAVAGAMTTLQLSAVAKPGNSVPLPLEEFQQLAAVFGLLKAEYVEPVDEKKLINDAIAGMVSGLDPHSAFFDKKHLKEFVESTTGRFVGVGIEIGMEDGLVRVVSPIEGSPAFRAGLRTNDLITRIDDVAVRGMTIDQAVKRMRGEPATKVQLTIFRKSESRNFPVTIVREEIKVQSVRSKVVEPGYAWLRVSQFQERTVDDFARKVGEIYQQEPNLKGLVLDLRNDPGGMLEAAIALSAAFLPADVEVVSTRGQLSSSQFSFRATPAHYLRRGQTDPLRKLPAALKNVPLIVLVNEGSASASEIVAGALQDHKRASVMGAQSFGKGSVQNIRCLAGQYPLEQCPTAAVKLTTSRFYTPNGNAIQTRGILPDVQLDETEEGNVIGALRTREADLEKHLSGAEDGDPKLREAREAERKRLEENLRARGKDLKPLPDFGSAEDWPLRQALNRLQGKPVVAAQAPVVRKAEAKAD